MIELNEKDIRAIAESRYEGSKRWFWKVVLLCFVIMFIIVLVLPEPYSYSAITPIIVMALLWVRHIKGLIRYEKEMVEKWHSEGGH